MAGEAARFVWGVAHGFGLGSSSPPERERALHEARGRVLGWLASHPLRDDRFEALLAERAEHSPDAHVRVVCRQLRSAWSDRSIRRHYVAREDELGAMPAWPAWEGLPRRGATPPGTRARRPTR